jgi:hypothetical protein
VIFSISDPALFFSSRFIPAAVFMSADGFAHKKALEYQRFSVSAVPGPFLSHLFTVHPS